MAKLHRASQLHIRDFGFWAATYDGMPSNGIALEKDWITCFTKMLDTSFDHDQAANGPWHELESALKQVRQVVMPRLLGALEAEGRQILPCFIHGDLWEDNIGTERSTGKIFIFDSNGYYAHHEMELAMWATEPHKMTSPRYLEEYLKHMQPSEPANEFEDRIRLYSLKNYLMYSANCRLSRTRQRLDLLSLHSDQGWKQLTDRCVAFLATDMSHICGLVAARVIPSHLDTCDVVATTLYKTFQGHRGAMILVRKNFEERSMQPEYDTRR